MTKPAATCEEMACRFLELFPEFEPTWTRHVESWSDEESRPGGLDLSVCAHFIVDHESELDRTNLAEYFELVEAVLREGDDYLSNAVATMFLENIQNTYSSRTQKFMPRHFIELLGEESRAHCRAWDEFTGHRTPGLFPDDIEGL